MQHSLFKHRMDKKRKYKRRKVVKYIPSTDLIRRLLLTKELYDRYGTLQNVASELKITRERVRQLLEKGQQYKLYKYELTRERQLRDLIMAVSKECLLEEIKNGTNRFKICLKFSINMNSYFRLIKHYQIDTQDYIIDVRKRKYLIRYSNMVDVLGYHPSTTEMQSRKSWRVSYNAIQHIWGSIDKFRQDYGIERPSHAMHPSTSSAWTRMKERQRQIKKEKIERVKDFIKINGVVDAKTICNTLGFKRQTTLLYLKELIINSEVKRINNKSSSQYVLNS